MEERYGIEKEFAHERAKELIPDEFFWDCTDELTPFGSDEGDTALAEWRNWRKRNPDKSSFDCLVWVIESVGEMDFSEYTENLNKIELIKQQLGDDEFDFEQYVNTLDISIIATGFGQFADEGKIDRDAKPIVQIALQRQTQISSLGRYGKDLTERYSRYLMRLKEILDKA